MIVEFTKRLKSLRGNNSQKAVAKEIGTDQQTLSRYETGDRTPDAEMLLRIADYYNVSTDYLLGRTEIPSIPTDGKLQAAAEVTGLSDAAITSLQKLYENNNMTWKTEILNMILESDEFLHILHYIEQSFTRPNKKIQYELLSTTTEDIGRTVITNYLNAILDKIREKFYGKQDYRDLYGIAHSLHEESKLTSEQYQRLCKELDMGDLSFFEQTFGK